jgi:hypothetical protein
LNTERGAVSSTESGAFSCSGEELISLENIQSRGKRERMKIERIEQKGWYRRTKEEEK